MPDPIFLLSSADIRREEIIEFVRTLQIPETRVIENPSQYYDAQLAQGQQNVWVALDNQELSELEEEEVELVRQKLGQAPHTLILLDIGKYEPSSQTLAVQLALAFAERWPCVVDNLLPGEDHRIYSAQEIAELRENGEKF